MRRIWFPVLCATLAIAACGKGDEPPAPTSGSPNAAPESGPARGRAAGGGGQAQAEAMFATVCANCHGTDGTANTEVAKALPVHPRNYTDAAWQASVTDAQIKEIILKGGAAVGKSPMMSGHPELESKPEVVDGLVKIIRGFGKK